MHEHMLSHELIKQYKKAYHFGDRAKKGEILDLLESVTHRSRKSLIRTLNTLWRQNEVIRAESMRTRKSMPEIAKTLPRRPGRPRKYSAEVDAALIYIWEAYNYPCAERLIGELKYAVEIFKRDQMWRYSRKATNALLKMPLGSMKRRLASFAKERGLMRGFSTTRASTMLREVPIFHGDWKSLGVGYGQIDTVVHSGEKLMGVMAYTVNFVDVATYWQEMVAQLGKDENTTLESLQTIRERLPFKMRGVHPDSGSEFLNHIILKWAKRHRIKISRSRPSKKNDNCYVEQRNNSTIRKYLGYERYDHEKTVKLMNDLYYYLRLYMNYFQPTFKLVGKYRKPNGQWVRKYDEARTPFQRVLERDDIPAEVKRKLLDEYGRLNPFKLRDRIEALTIKLRKEQQKLGYRFESE